MKSIKTKIVFMTIALLFAVGTIVVSAAVMAFYHDKELLIAANYASITAFEGQINTEITELEKNALDLALVGEIYFQKSKKPAIGEFFTQRILRNYPDSMGNGIYFVPYKIYEDQEIACIHAFWQENGEIGLLPSCVNGRFAYPQQNWYSEIVTDFKAGRVVSWARPYKSTQLGILMTTVGAGIYNGDDLVGMATVDWELDTILKTILKMKPTPNSFVLFADKINDYIIATTEQGVDNDAIMGKSLADIKWYSEDLTDGVAFEYNGKQYIPHIKQLKNGFFLIVNVPLFELFNDAVRQLWLLLGIFLTSTVIIVLFLYHILKRSINRPIDKLTDIAQEISEGNLEKTIYLEDPSELAKLAYAFNKMKTDIKKHLTELAEVSMEKERMASELAIAKTIQDSALPKDFPDTENFGLSASMTPAKEVGGDFYDFFPIDENHCCFVMADVCGKGITAALYMMSAKTAIKNMLQAGYPLDEAINKANKTLYDNNAPGMFVTVFVGVLDLQSGVVEYVNAGHCKPLHKTGDGYAYVDVVRNMVLGAKSNYEYKTGRIVLQENERLFLYTDGVTEAQTKDNEFFGAERLLEILNEKNLGLKDTLDYVHEEIQNFVKDAPQFDDITMLIVEFYRKR